MTWGHSNFNQIVTLRLQFGADQGKGIGSYLTAAATKGSARQQGVGRSHAIGLGAEPGQILVF
jgi:hypothetical protein